MHRPCDACGGGGKNGGKAAVALPAQGEREGEERERTGIISRGIEKEDGRGDGLGRGTVFL